ncbi:unnamed protein product [Leptidea sinapis]|uniref:Sodium/solute symporter n=1 Tax=Leptidea sinapis TaxID=189913 RepID=A0A5E4PXY5_9NEOP|nr:unnamed protein product [Leptidea sinapis]
MNSGWLAWECIIFAVFVCASSCAPLWRRKKDATAAGGNAKRAYIFAGGGVSILSMMLSVSRGTLGVRSFLGFPSEFFYFGSALWETLYGMILAFPVVCCVFIPVFFRLHTNSVYEYLELRFGSKAIRRIAAATFLLRQVLNLAVTVYTPTVALHAVLGLPHWASAAALTIVGIIFNVLGGLAAAIRADVIQTLAMVIVSGAFIIQGTVKVGGIGQVVQDNIDGGRLNFFNFLVSNMNSLSTVTWEDFVSAAPAFRGITDKQQLTIIKIIGVIYALMIMGLSLCVGMVNGVIEANLLVTSATSGALLGVFLLGALFPMANGKGALCGMIISQVVTTWMAVGRLLYINKSVASLPVSVEHCSNTTLSVLKPLAVVANHTLTQYAPIFDAIDSTHPQKSTSENSMQEIFMTIYSISYMWYAVIGTFTCVAIGIIIGYITGSESDQFDERLLHPLVARIARKMPGKQRIFSTPDREKTPDENETSDKTCDTTVDDKPSVIVPVFTSQNSIIFEDLTSTKTRL